MPGPRCHVLVKPYYHPQLGVNSHCTPLHRRHQARRMRDSQVTVGSWVGTMSGSGIQVSHDCVSVAPCWGSRLAVPWHPISTQGKVMVGKHSALSPNQSHTAQSQVCFSFQLEELRAQQHEALLAMSPLKVT